MIPIFRSAETAGARALEVLSGAESNVELCESWSAFMRAIGPEVGTALVIQPWLDDPVINTRNQLLMNQRPWCRVVLMTLQVEDNLRRLGPLEFYSVLLLNKDEPELPAELRRAESECVFWHLIAQVRSNHSLPTGLRRALVFVLSQQPAAGPVEHASGPAHSVREVGRRIGVSESHLRRVSREHDVDLKKLLSWCIALRALQLHDGQHTSWEQVAWRFGYRSVSGLAQHLERTLGARPTTLNLSQARLYFVQFEQAFDTSLGRDHKDLPSRISGKADARSEVLNGDCDRSQADEERSTHRF